MALVDLVGCLVGYLSLVVRCLVLVLGFGWYHSLCLAWPGLALVIRFLLMLTAL